MNQARLALAFALALGLAASYFVYKKLQQGSVKASAAKVLTAARNLEIGTKLQKFDVKVVDWPSGSPSGSFSKEADVMGRAVLYPTFEDEPILAAKLAAVGSGAGLSAVIPEGMRAVSIRVDDVVAVAGFVGPGARVDVLLTGKPGGGGLQGNPESVTKTILENVQVLAAGQKIQPDAQGKPETVNVVTLLCVPEDAAKVTLAASEGRIQLVLRNPTDQIKKENETMVARATLYKGSVSEPAKPAKAPPRPRPQPVAAPVAPPPPPPATTTSIHMIRGEKVSTVELNLRNDRP